MTKLLIFDAFTLLICEKNVANYALFRCKTFSLKIWLCKILENIMSAYDLTNTSHRGDLFERQSAGVAAQVWNRFLPRPATSETKTKYHFTISRCSDVMR